MDIQNKAKKLIEMIQTAPVEWKPLGEVAELKRGKTITAKVAIDGGIPVISGGQQPAYYHNEANRTGETITVAGSGAYAGFIMYWDEPIFVSDAFSIKPNIEVLNTRYIYYFLLQNQGKIYNLKKGSGVPHVYPKDLALLTIPIPPLETQQKIVKILDKFTELEATLEATLEAELALRKRQYQYYRDFLLDFDNQIGGRIADGYQDRLKDVVWKTLGEVGTLIRGNGLQKKDFTEDGIPAIHYGQIYTHYGTFASKTKSFVSTRLAEKLKKAQYGDVLIAGTSENIQDVMTPVGWLGGEIVFSGDMFAFRPNTEINTKYLTYMLQTTMFQKYKEKYAQGTKVIRVKGENFLKFEIPIPPLAEQEKIVAILDKFDTLTHSISEGLPHEIALRRKQYEYYREQLLAFPKAA